MSQCLRSFSFHIFQGHSNCHEIFLKIFSVRWICSLWCQQGQFAGNTVLLLYNHYLYIYCTVCSFQPLFSIIINIASVVTHEYCISRSWNIAANDNHLWELQYGVLFGAAKQRATRLVENRNSRLFSEPIDSRTITDWKEAVKKAYNGKLNVISYT